MRNNFLKYFLVFFTLIAFKVSSAQTFGFGCLGLSGFYAGYSQQEYNASGVNAFVISQTSIIDPSYKIEFKRVTGYRIGANIFRAKFHGLFITAKGYYQFLKQAQSITVQNQAGTIKQNYELDMNHWGAGIDFGVSLFTMLDWKIVEGNVLFYNAEYSQEYFLNDISSGVDKFKPDKNKIGYFVGSGLILHIVPDYVSVEGSAGYTIIQIDKMSGGNNAVIPLPNTSQYAVEKGGFSATVQLNIGFPL